MSAVYFLTLRQLSGKWRILIMTVLAVMPVLIAMLMVSEPDAPSVREFEQAMLGAMLAGSIAPLVVLAIAGPAFANEIEDRTIANLTLSPLPRWKIVLPKLLGVITIAGPFVVASAFATSWAAFLGDWHACLAVAGGSLLGVVLYASAFTWLGLVSTQAIGIGLLYIVLWEGFFSGFVAGARALSIRYHTLALMHAFDDRRIRGMTHVSASTALIVAAALVTLFFWLSVRRMKRMDIP
jgi:ABC-2 type transport system permease protein